MPLYSATSSLLSFLERWQLHASYMNSSISLLPTLDTCIQFRKMLRPSIFAACALPLVFAAPFCASNGTATCDLSNLSQPANTLTPPASDQSLVLIAHGQGTQNYTCVTPTSIPSAIGAIAQLFNASCETTNPGVTSNNIVPAAAIGNHFFTDLATPYFDIPGLGNTKTKKVEEVAAPNSSADIKWLRLQAQGSDSTSQVKYIYRLNTIGGLAPVSCEGRAQGEVITVQYDAQYWVYV